MSERKLIIHDFSQNDFFQELDTYFDRKLEKLYQRLRPKSFTTDQVAELSRCSIQKIRLDIKKGILKAKKVGRNFIITEEALENYLKDVKSLNYRR